MTNLELYKKRSRRKKREETKSVFIAVEGGTEEIYFADLVYKLSIKAQVEVTCKSSDLKNTIDSIYTSKNRKKFSQIWCVFDVPENPEQLKRFKQAINNARSSTSIQFAISVPEIEVWFLFHFSSAAAALSTATLHEKLKRSEYIPNYEKGKSFRDVLHPRLNQAILNTKKVRDSLSYLSDEYVNPSTNVDILVEELMRLSPRFNKEADV